MTASSAAADRAAAALALRAHLARPGWELLPVRWVAPGEIRTRAAETAALQSIVPAGRVVATAADWRARTASAPGVLFAFAAIGGALLGALPALGGGVAGRLLRGTGGAVIGSLLASLLAALLALACADRVGLAVDRGARALGGGVGPRRRAASGAEIGDALGCFLGLLGAIFGALSWGWIGFAVGMVGGPIAGAFVGALLGALIGAGCSGIETLSRALFRDVAGALGGGLARSDRVTACVLAATSVGALASMLGLVVAVGLGAAPVMVIGAVLGTTVGSFLGAACGAATRGRARWIALWHPSPSSAETALWLFWPRAGEVVAASRPALRLADGALHCEDGPAVVWPPRVRGWYWHGASVPRRLIESPEALSAEEIRGAADPDVRLAIVERLGGIEPFMRKVGADFVQQDDYGRLWRGPILPPDSEPTATVVEVKDTTSGAVSLLRVPPRTQTAREAVAWTFGFERAQEYAPAVET